jgi:hypothetical protein
MDKTVTRNYWPAEHTDMIKQMPKKIDTIYMRKKDYRK